MDIFQAIKPKISKRYLLFIAALVWTFAGGMLLYKGIFMFSVTKSLLGLRIIISIIGGILFYILLFSKISLKHVNRIIKLKIENPCLFSFFNVKSYVLMAIMITSGIFLRKSGIISPEYFSIIYISMGIPLFISAFRFYYYGINYTRFVNQFNIIFILIFFVVPIL